MFFFQIQVAFSLTLYLVTAKIKTNQKKKKSKKQISASLRGKSNLLTVKGDQVNPWCIAFLTNSRNLVHLKNELAVEGNAQEGN